MKGKLLLMGFVLMLCTTMLFGSKVSAAQGRELELDGKAAKGSTKESVTYIMEPESNGIIKVKIFYASLSPMKAVLKNVSSNTVREFASSYVDGKTLIEFEFCADKTKYELTINFVNGSIDIKHSITAKLKKINSSTGGKSMDNPIKMSSIDRKEGVIGFGEEADCYKIVLKEQETLKLGIQNYSPESLTLKVYDTYKNLIKLEIIPTSINIKEFIFNEANGVYYVTLERVDVVGLGVNYAVTTGDYVAISKLSLPKSKMTLKVGDVKTLKATVTPSDATEGYSFKSSNKKVVTVNSYGKIRAVKAGTATVAVYSNNGKVIARCKITVKKAPTPVPTKAPTKSPTPIPTKIPTETNVKVTGINADSNMLTLDVGEKKTITYKITPSNATNKTVTFSTKDSSIATVDSKGVVTGVSTGRTTIIGTTSNGKTIAISIIVS